jgi:protein CpxP
MENEDKDLSGRGAGKAVSKGWGRHAAIGGLAAVAAVSAVGFAAARSDDFGFGMGRFGMGGHVMHAHMGGGGLMEHRIDTMLDELDATPEQEDKLWDIIDNARAEIRPTFRGLPRDARRGYRTPGRAGHRPGRRRKTSQRAHCSH